MNEESTAVTLLVTTVLEEFNIPYLIGGSLASALHGVARATLDSDLVAEIQPSQVPLLVERLQDEFYISTDAIGDALAHRTSFNLIHLKTMFKVDIFVSKGRPFDQAQMRNRQAHVIATDPEQRAYAPALRTQFWQNWSGIVWGVSNRSANGAMCSGWHVLKVSALIIRICSGWLRRSTLPTCLRA